MDIQTLTPVLAYTALPNQTSAVQREGEIRPGHGLHTNSAPVCVCINQRGTYRWEPLRYLSSARWNCIRGDVAKSLETSFGFIKPSKIERLKKELQVKDEALLILKDLFGKLSRKDKLALLERHHKTFMGRHTCRACLTLCNKLTYCIHTDCTGLCKSCAEKNKDTCLACGQKQEKECPICQEKKSNDDLIASSSESCRHTVCYKCYAMAFQQGHPIWNCPLCRGEFTKAKRSHRPRRLNFESAAAAEDSDLSESDDEEWEDYADFAALETNSN